MLFKNDFYFIKNISQSSENQAEFEIKFNTEHKIFAAHFPKNPIVPGVLEIQIAIECLSEILQKTLELRIVKNVKFINPVFANNYKSVIYKLEWNDTENGLLQIKGVIFNNETVFAKMNLIVH